MMFHAKDWDFICAKNENAETYDLLIYNPVREEQYLEEGIDESYLKGVDSYGEPYAAVEVSAATLETIRRGLYDGYTVGFFEEWEEDEEPCSAKGNEFSKETVWRAIRAELSPKELATIARTQTIKRANYYDFETFMRVIQDFMQGKITRDYFVHWLIVVSCALNHNLFKENSPKYLLYEALADMFDGVSFNDWEGKRDGEVRELIAYLKYYHHQLSQTGKKNPPPLYSEGEVAVFVLFDFWNGYNEHWRVCIADEKNEIFKFDLVANPDFLENVNYNFVRPYEFDSLTSDYYDFYYDPSIETERYIARNPYLDRNGNPVS